MIPRRTLAAVCVQPGGTAWRHVKPRTACCHQGGRCVPPGPPAHRLGQGPRRRATRSPTPRGRGDRLLAAAVVAALLAAAAAPGCRTRRDLCGDPVAVARAFVERLEGGESAAALGLVSRAGRGELDRRAREASSRLGQRVEPRELLVPERSVLARPEWLVLRSAAGDEAWVDVRPPADAGSGEGDAPWGAQRLVREDGCWRVDLFHGAGGSGKVQ